MKKQLIKIIFLLSIYSSETVAQKVIFTFNNDVSLKDWVIVEYIIFHLYL